MCEKGKKWFASKSDERGKKSALLGENLWTVRGKDSTILWSLLAKYGFSFI